VLRRGASGAAVAEIRARLAQLGLCAEPPASTDLAAPDSQIRRSSTTNSTAPFVPSNKSAA